jgi:hypothetical protein
MTDRDGDGSVPCQPIVPWVNLPRRRLGERRTGDQALGSLLQRNNWRPGREVNRHAEAMRFFDRAIKVAEEKKDCGLPFIAYEGKAQALVAMGKPNEARNVLENALVKARSQQKRGHEAQLLILLGSVAAGRHGRHSSGR